MLTELLTYIIKEITGSDNFSVTEEADEEGKIILQVKADPSIMGIIIGKGGNTIKAITTVVRVRGRIDQKLVNIDVSEA